MTILVTGAGGHLGHLVVDALLGRGVAASTSSRAHTPPRRSPTSPRGASARRTSTMTTPRRSPRHSTAWIAYS